jgi:BirA family transcriptional regulator, biotin operon repressor / biotin---[acetyl-CoA-carboxylase] ligase
MFAAPFGELRRLDVVGSTNAYLLEEARRGAPAGLVVVADHQTAGRGRLGRRWEAPPGSSLLVSVLLRPVVPPDDLHLCTAAVALATAGACRTVAGVWPTVKWPNDLLVGDDKLAGVLAEADPAAPGGPPGSVAAVVGVGCNVDWPGPPGTGGTCLRDAAGRAVDREELLQALLTELGPRVEALASGDGRRGLGDELRDRCRTLGQVVRVTLAGTGVVEDGVVGRAVDLTAEGHLVVDTGDGRLVVAAGDVVHLRPADGARHDR